MSSTRRRCPRCRGRSKNPVLTNDINVNGTLNLLVAGPRGQGQAGLFSPLRPPSTGTTRSCPSAKGKKGTPLSPYAVSKLVGEKYCRLFYNLYGLGTVSLRYFNIFGPRQDPLRSTPRPSRCSSLSVLTGTGPRSSGTESSPGISLMSPTSSRPTSGPSTLPKSALGEVFNIACGERMTVNSLVAEIGDTCSALRQCRL